MTGPNLFNSSPRISRFHASALQLSFRCRRKGLSATSLIRWKGLTRQPVASDPDSKLSTPGITTPFNLQSATDSLSALVFHISSYAAITGYYLIRHIPKLFFLFLSISPNLSCAQEHHSQIRSCHTVVPESLSIMIYLPDKNTRLQKYFHIGLFSCLVCFDLILCISRL